MSHSSSATVSLSTTQPLSDILPWGSPLTTTTTTNVLDNNNDDDTAASAVTSECQTNNNNHNRTLLITDSVSADGRFLLHTLALQFLSSRYNNNNINNIPNKDNNNSSTAATSSGASKMLLEGAVLWITLSPVSERQVVMALRKGMQHNLGGVGGGGGNHSSSGGGGGGVHAMMGNHATSSSSGTSSGGGGGITGRIHVVSVPLEVADGVLQQHDDDDDDDDDNNHHSEENTEEQQQQSFSNERYLKQLHQRIVHWLKHRELLSPSQYNEQQRTSEQNHQTGNNSSSSTTASSMGPNLIIIDNGTMLSTMFGETLSNAFISSVRATMRSYSQISSTSHTVATTDTITSPSTTAAAVTTTTVVNTTNLLTIRITSPDDGGLYQPNDEDNVMKGEKLRSEYSRLLRPWLGMGSGHVDSSSSATTTTETTMNITQLEEQCNYLSLSTKSTVPSMVYRCGLYELADAIVDVSPLESGYARDVLGRLSFATTWSGKGWWGGGGGAAVAPVAGVNSGAAGSSSRVGNTNHKDEVNRAYSSICVNYRCDDSGVRVMRLRSR